MKKLLSLSVLAVLFAFLTFAGFFDILHGSAKGSSSYVSARHSLESAELSLKRTTRVFAPDVSLGFGTGGLTLTQDGFQPLSVSLDISVLRIGGFSIGFAVPLRVELEDFSASLSHPSIRISNSDLFGESRVQTLNSQASYLDSLFRFKDTFAEIFISTAQSILDKYVLDAKIDLAYEELHILKNRKEHARTVEELEVLTRDTLSKEAEILRLKSSLIGYGDLEVTETLYHTTVEILTNMISALEIDPDSWLVREDMVAASLRVEAEEIQSRNWYYPYLPKISISLSLTDFAKPAFSFRLDFNLSVYDQGERRLEASRRQLGIERLRFEEKHRQLSNSVQVLLIQLESLEIDKALASMIFEKAIQDLEKNSSLLEKGFISPKDFSAAEIALSRAQLSLIEARHQYLFRSLDLLRTLGYEFPASQSDLERLLQRGDRDE